jgi:hypothetical protein
VLPAFTLAAPPQLPHIFYGNVISNGSNVPVNTVIIAKVGGVEKGRITVDTAGKFGGAGALDEKLLVQGSIANGSIISFYIGDSVASQTAYFGSGNIQQLNLTFTTTSSSSGGNTGGGGGGTTNPTATATLAVGNIKGHGVVDEYDFSLVMSQWGQTGSNLSADVNKDGIVDEYDFSLLMANWGL